MKNTIKFIKPKTDNQGTVDNNNLGNLKYLIKYFSKIKDQGLIDDEKFKLLVVIVCQNFIECEIEARINKKIGHGISSLLNFFQHATR